MKSINKFDKKIKFFNSLSQAKKILDLGCGIGNNGNILKNIFPQLEIYGVDVYLSKVLPDFYVFTKANIENDKLPFPNNFFDAIIFSHVIEHLNYVNHLGGEINRIMKKGARIYVETPKWTSILMPSFGIYKSHERLNFYDDPTHIRPWTKQSLYQFIFESCNLKVNHIKSTRNWVRLLFDFPVLLLYPFMKKHIAPSLRNIFGLFIYGIGIKE